MSRAKVTSKGQITIPVDVRKALDLVPGSKVDFVRIDDHTFEFTSTTGSVRDLKGMLPPPERALTLDEMEQAVAAGALGLDATR